MQCIAAMSFAGVVRDEPTADPKLSGSGIVGEFVSLQPCSKIS